MAKRGNGRGLGTVYWRENVHCWYGLVTVGTKPDGTRDRRAVRGRVGDDSTQERDRVALELASLRVQASKGTLPSYEASMRLADFAAKWKSEHLRIHRSPITVQGYTWHMDTYVLPKFGKRRLDSIRRVDVQQLLNDMHRAGKGMEILHQTRSALSSCLRCAMEWDILPFNAADKARLPKAETATEPREERVLTIAEAHRLLEETQGHVNHTIWLLMLGGGLRGGEACGLRWADIDWEKCELTVRSAMKSLRLRHGGPQQGPPKNGKARRVPLPQFVRDALLSIMSQQAKRVRVYRGDWTPQDLVVQTDRCTLISPHNLAQRLAADLRRLDIPYVRPHVLRHTSATMQKQQGVDPEVIRDNLGHKSWDTTQIYTGHLTATEKQSAADSLDRAFGYRNGYTEPVSH